MGCQSKGYAHLMTPITDTLHSLSHHTASECVLLRYYTTTTCMTSRGSPFYYIHAHTRTILLGMRTRIISLALANAQCSPTEARPLVRANLRARRKLDFLRMTEVTLPLVTNLHSYT